MRVRNIFICSGVVFCASSRMMNEWLSVRPRMYASGAISIVLPLEQLRRLVEAHQVVERVVERPQVRIDLLREVAGQEAEPLARFDGGTHEHDALDRVALERVDRARDREIGLAGARRPDAERDVVRRIASRYAIWFGRAAVQVGAARAQQCRRRPSSGDVG